MDQLSNLLAILRAAHLAHWTAHWRCAGATAYADHLLFARLYEGMVDEIDGLAEKVVAMVGSDAVALPAQMEQMTRVLQMWVERFTGKGLIECALMIEASIQEALEKVCACPDLSLGLENFIQGIADHHETSTYLLQQRMGPALITATSKRNR
jgi:DNA-binding ferritin-like protein